MALDPCSTERLAGSQEHGGQWQLARHARTGMVAIHSNISEELDTKDAKDGHDKQYDSKRVEDTGDGTRNGAEDLVQRLHALEQAKDPKGSKISQQCESSFKQVEHVKNADGDD